ncbi:hypothetical protein [[Scytonema hofmanni] UTEX B 1581]|nr:hypothetical protein [[Scytonema hofmanni] UTEX B 1581]
MRRAYRQIGYELGDYMQSRFGISDLWQRTPLSSVGCAPVQP